MFITDPLLQDYIKTLTEKDWDEPLLIGEKIMSLLKRHFAPDIDLHIVGRDYNVFIMRVNGAVHKVSKIERKL